MQASVLSSVMTVRYVEAGRRQHEGQQYGHVAVGCRAARLMRRWPATGLFLFATPLQVRFEFTLSRHP